MLETLLWHQEASLLGLVCVVWALHMFAFGDRPFLCRTHRKGNLLHALGCDCSSTEFPMESHVWVSHAGRGGSHAMTHMHMQHFFDGLCTCVSNRALRPGLPCNATAIYRQMRMPVVRQLIYTPDTTDIYMYLNLAC